MAAGAALMPRASGSHLSAKPSLTKEGSVKKKNRNATAGPRRRPLCRAPVAKPSLRTRRSLQAPPPPGMGERLSLRFPGQREGGRHLTAVPC